MQSVALVGGACSLLSVVGYAIAIHRPFPGRAFAVTGLMVGLSLFLIGRALEDQP